MGQNCVVQCNVVGVFFGLMWEHLEIANNKSNLLQPTRSDICSIYRIKYKCIPVIFDEFQGRRSLPVRMQFIRKCVEKFAVVKAK